MIPLPDGTFRYWPRDLVAYLVGDFAAWCERMLAERQRDCRRFVPDIMKSLKLQRWLDLLARVTIP